MNRAKLLPLLLLAAGTGGCGYDPAEETVQRDVYTKLEDCIADWGNQELCAQTLKEEKRAVTNAQGVTVYEPYYIYSGPSYYPGNRYVDMGSSRITPSTSRAFTTNSFSRSSISPGAAARSGIGSGGSGLASRGGFGGTGSSISSSVGASMGG